MNLDFVPLWVFFVGTIVLILVSIEAGFAVGRHFARRDRAEKEAPTAAMGGAVLGLLAFMLAFTFGIASGRFDLRKQLVRDDSDAIRTTWLRAELLSATECDDIRALLTDYVDIRLSVARSGHFALAPEGQAKSMAIQQQLWGLVVANGKKDLNSDIGAMLIDSVNDLINTHARRVSVGIDSRVPLGIWCVLFALSILGMTAVGYHTGITGSTRSRASLLLAVSFSLVITLIAGLDRPNTWFVSVTQKPLHDLKVFMEHAGRDHP